MRRTYRTRIKAVEDYNEGGTLKQVARRYGIHYVTLYHWIRWYKTEYQSSCKQTFYKKPWNRYSRSIEKEVILAREYNPSVTLRQAQEVLGKKQIFISLKGIYEIWKRYNYIRRSPVTPFSPFGPLTTEGKQVIEQVKILLKSSKDNSVLKKAANILNDLPSFPAKYENILTKIPYRLLSPRRKLDKLDAEFISTSKLVLYQKLKKLRKTFEDKEYFYSSILAGVLECLSLHWMRTPGEEIKLHRLLVDRMGKLRDPVLNFVLDFLAGTAHAGLLHIKQTRIYVQKCKRRLHSIPNITSYTLVGDLMTFTCDYHSALQFYSIALRMGGKKDKQKNLLLKTGLAAVISGRYRDTISRYLKNLHLKPDDAQYETYLLIKALSHLGQGKIEKATQCLLSCLEKSKKQQFRNYIYTTSTCLAAIQKVLGNNKEAETILKKSLPLLEKYCVRREALAIKFLLGKIKFDKEIQKFPVFHIMSQLDKAHTRSTTKEYGEAITYAQKKGLLGFFHRCTVFYPNPVLILLKKGKKTGLSKSMLQLPIFNKEMPVYYIKFIGKLTIYRNHKNINVKLKPKEKALLIHLVRKIGEPGKSTAVNDILHNFWSRSKAQSSRLSHFLVGIRRALKMPKYLMVITSYAGVKCIVNQGFYVITDYTNFKIAITEAKALQRVDEWIFARNRYLQAFALVRGEPFSKMYDNWSESTRRIILTELAHEVRNFTRTCFDLKDNKNALKIKTRFDRIIPAAYRT
ncbi:MAG: helix-turn-helix domain-containing protein [bacterium]